MLGGHHGFPWIWGLHTARGRIEEDPATGDGIRMAEAVGAGLVGMEYVLAIPFWGGRVLDYPGAEIFLTARGERFTDETASWDTVLADLTAAGGSEFWVITDSRSRKGATFATKVQQGLVESAASLKELAKKMNISSAQLSEVFARYNEAARTGADPDFRTNAVSAGIEGAALLLWPRTVRSALHVRRHRH